MHLHRTIENRCPECLIEADQATALVVSGVAGARLWAERVLARRRGSRDVREAPVSAGRHL